MSDAPPAPPAPPDLPPPRKRGVAFWLLVCGGVLLAVCGGVALLVWDHVSGWVDIAKAPPGEREQLLSKKLGEMAAEETKAVDAFLVAVDESRDDDAWAMTTPGFRVKADRAKFGEITTLARSAVGRVKSKQLRNVETITKLDVTRCHLVYSATFEKGDGTIEMTLERDGDGWRIFAWHVNSPLFTEAMKKGAGK